MDRTCRVVFSAATVAMAILLVASRVCAASDSTLPAPRLSTDRTHVVDGNNGDRPLFFNGDTAWSLIAELSREETELYLSRRRGLGFNVVLVNLIEHEFARRAPANFYGARPFLVAGDFSTPNEAYFAHADWVIANAAAKGMVVMIAPLYLGYEFSSQGWGVELKANQDAQIRSYGRYLGKRYRDFPNIVWVIGGDTDPTAVASKVREFVAGLKEFDPGHLITAHNRRGQAAVEPWPREDWLDLNNVYTAGPDAAAVNREYSRRPFKPLFLIEGRYEHERSDAGTAFLRAQAYVTILSGGYQGHFFGNCPMWAFGARTSSFCATTDWKARLNSEGSRTLALVGKLFAGRAFYMLVPDWNRSVVTWSERHRFSAAARAADGSSVIAYLPQGGSATVDMAKLMGKTAHARWFDPRTGAVTPAGSDLPTDGNRTFVAPTNGDWVLVVDAVSGDPDNLSQGWSAPANSAAIPAP